MKYVLAIVGLAISALCAADDKRTTRQDLIGAWRLVEIQVQVPAGQIPPGQSGAGRTQTVPGSAVHAPGRPEGGGREAWRHEADPFYGNGSHGLLIYDASGWFSVQIEGADRPAVTVPGARPVAKPTEADAKALHTYYAYFGTWSFDAATSTVTHHAKGALYPSEDAAVYPQHVEVVGGRMTFSRAQNGKIQTKLWERVTAR